MTKFYVIEGLDGSGKNTQTLELEKYYKELGKKVLILDYPRYEDDSSTMVRKYLNGGYGNIDDISIYQASTFYAMDRLDHYLSELKKEWNNYDIIIANRYVSSNLLHQGGRLLESITKKSLESMETAYKDHKETFDHPYPYDQFKNEWLEEIENLKEIRLKEFRLWLENYEYNTLNIPKPNKVIFLNIGLDKSLENINKRGNKKDLHENKNHLKWAYEAFSLLDWTIIDCLEKDSRTQKKIVEIRDLLIGEIKKELI